MCIRDSLLLPSSLKAVQRLASYLSVWSMTTYLLLPLKGDLTFTAEKVIRHHSSKDQDSRFGNRTVGRCNSKGTLSFDQGYFLTVTLTIQGVCRLQFCCIQ